MGTDLDALLNSTLLSTGGVAAVFTTGAGVAVGTYTVTPPLIITHREGGVQSDFQQSGEEIAIGMDSADAANIKPRNKALILSANYLVLTINPDASGWSTLNLERIIT